MVFPRSRSFAMLACVAAIGFSGCAKDPTTGAVSIDPNLIANVQQITSITCGIAPVAESIIALFNAGIASTAQTLSDAICKSIVQKASASRRSLVVHRTEAPNTPIKLGSVRGIPIYGTRK